MTTMTLPEFTKMVTDNANTNRWLNCTTPVQHEGSTYSIGIKAFGLWVQRMEVNGLRSDVSEQKTKKAFSAALTLELLHLMTRQGVTA